MVLKKSLIHWTENYKTISLIFIANFDNLIIFNDNAHLIPVFKNLVEARREPAPDPKVKKEALDFN